MRLALLLLAFACGLAWLSASLRADDAARQGAVVAAVRAQAAPVANAESAPAEASFAVASGPPLFRPMQTAAAQPQAGEALALVGIVAREDARIALFRDQAGARSWRASVGERVGDWTVAEIDAQCVTLRRGGRRQQVCL
jgi:hypothetical protein